MPTSYIIAGCCKNCEEWLPCVIANIQLIRDHINVLEVVISYDRSSDRTLDILEQTTDFHIIIGDADYRSRTQAIAVARNRILDYINGEYADIDRVIMMDMDDICAGKLDISVLLSAMETDNWDALSFNMEPYRDWWALSVGVWQYSIWHFRNPERLLDKLREYLANLLNSSPILYVDSAFGGFAIYKWRVFKKYRYEHRIIPELFDISRIFHIIKHYRTNLMSRDFDDCEHRAFHLRARKDGARIVLLRDILFSNESS